MNNLIYSAILSASPISELRGGIPLAIGYGYPPLVAYIVCVVANIAIIPLVFLFLDFLHKYFYKNNFYRKNFDKFIERTSKKAEKHMGTRWESIALFVFVAVPFPLTGAYTGTLISWIFKLNRKKSYLTIVSGVLAAGIIVTLVSIGLFSLF